MSPTSTPGGSSARSPGRRVVTSSTGVSASRGTRSASSRSDGSSAQCRSSSSSKVGVEQAHSRSQISLRPSSERSSSESWAVAAVSGAGAPTRGPTNGSSDRSPGRTSSIAAARSSAEVIGLQPGRSRTTAARGPSGCPVPNASNRPARTARPRTSARRAISAARRDLPQPASPTRCRAEPAAAALSNRRSAAASSSARPTSGVSPSVSNAPWGRSIPATTATITASRRFLTVSGRTSPTRTRESTASRVDSSISVDPGAAAAIRRAARFVVSPSALTKRRERPPNVAANARPVATPAAKETPVFLRRRSIA